METAADVFGIPQETDNNGGVHESAAVVQRNFKGPTIDAGMRMGTFMAYLRPAMARQPKVSLSWCVCVCVRVCLFLCCCACWWECVYMPTSRIALPPTHTQ